MMPLQWGLTFCGLDLAPKDGHHFGFGPFREATNAPRRSGSSAYSTYVANHVELGCVSATKHHSQYERLLFTSRTMHMLFAQTADVPWCLFNKTTFFMFHAKASLPCIQYNVQVKTQEFEFTLFD